MGFQREVLKPGNGKDRAVKGDVVTIEYTGNLLDKSVGKEKHYRGKQFDSSVDRGDFKTEIGIGKVIKGWDEGVPEMTLGERAILTITPGFYDLIPPNSTLVFEVELKAINSKKA